MVYQQPLTRMTNNDDYGLNQELYGVVLHIQVSTIYAQQGITLRSNTSATEEVLTSGSWHKNVDLQTLEATTKQNKDLSVYKVTLPMNDWDEHLSLEIRYTIEADEQKITDRTAPFQIYLLQRNPRKRVSYSAIFDTEKHNLITEKLTSVAGKIIMKDKE